MKQYFCDKCKCKVEDETDLFILEIKSREYFLFTYELCKDCMEELKDAFN